MGSMQSTNHLRKRYRVPASIKSIDSSKHKRSDRFRTTMRSITLRTLAARNYHNSVSSSNNSAIYNSSFTAPNTITTINSQIDGDSYLSDFDYRKLSTLTGLSESKINELHREFLILSQNGRLTYERYKSMLETIPVERNPIQLDQLARQTFTLFDKDGNNYLDFAEFIAAFITMEKNELGVNDKSLRADQSTHPSITSITRQATTYYSPQRTLNSSSHLPNNYISYQPESSEQYAYVSSQRKFR